MKATLFSALLILSSIISNASLEWESKSITLKPSFDEKSISGEFKFKNSGDKPLIIIETKSSCGCTVPTLKKDVYAPGESGVITAKFDIGSRRGIEEKDITVYTDDPKEGEISLKLRVEIPEVVTVSPVFLLWKVGDGTGGKTVQLEASEGYTVEITEQSSNNMNFSVTGVVEEKGKKFTFTIKPNSTEKGDKASIYISAMINNIRKIYTINAHIK